MLTPLFYFESVMLALRQIWANKLRSILTALGIIVGVASTTAVIAALTGLKTKVLAEFETFGAARIYVWPSRPEGVPRNLFPWEKIRLRKEEAAAIAEQCTSLKGITPISETTLSVQSDGENLDGVSVTGIWPAWHATENRQVIMGRPFSQADIDNARQVCLVNDLAVRDLQLPTDPVGEHLIIGGRRFLIVGVVETITERMTGFNTISAELFIPHSLMDKFMDRDYFMRFVALANSPAEAEDAQADITRVLRKVRGLGSTDLETFRVQPIDQFIDQFKSVASGITAVAGGIVAISLLVGGIGIMNIMLVSVSERTREIGLRKAVGATPTAILLQFLLEAVTLCLAGGLIGVLIGQGFALAVSSIPGARLENSSVPAWAVALAFVFSAAVGVIFGMFPAIKASRLDPIEALRHE
ncbi:MAG: FtsX-like permease family protein [Planctomycetes bacterium]|nr:FtsX-like permease family protein [Planctomycetota bacterium]